MSSMSSSEAEQLKVDLREAYEHGDLNLSEYLAELRKLRPSKMTSAAVIRLGIDLLRWIVRYGGAG